MRNNYIVVNVFGVENVNISSSQNSPFYEATEFDCRCYLTDKDIFEVLERDDPDVILTIGKLSNFKNLNMVPYEYRKRWIHKENLNDLNDIGSSVMFCYINGCVNNQDRIPLVTVFTPTYKTGDRIFRALNSLKNQTYSNWEWVIFDDSDDNNVTFNMLNCLASKDPRISLYKSNKNSGIIGEVKHRACMLARGSILVELDHDDELTNNCLEMIVAAFNQYPESGFVYTDFAEELEDGNPATYGGDWAFGYGSYRDEKYNGKILKVACSPTINAKTIRHIVGVPNHTRAWKKDFYIKIGGHNRRIHVCDDYELLIRTFLNTKMIKIPKLGYIQYHSLNGGNTQRKRNSEIQRLVRYFREAYDKQIHKRLIELGSEDFIWNEETQQSHLIIKSDFNVSHCCLIANV
jgi:O-antigen biosynthesis protein